MIRAIVRLICCCIFTSYTAYEESEQADNTRTIPYEIEFHLGNLKSSYLLLYGYASRFKRLPWPKEIYLNRKLGEWVQTRVKLKETDTLSLHEIRAMGYIYDLTTVFPPHPRGGNLSDHQKRVISCPVELVNLWSDAETSARYIYLWCFIKQFNRYPVQTDVYFNFSLGVWYGAIINDVSSATRKSLDIISKRIPGAASASPSTESASEPPPYKSDETTPLLPK